MQREVTDVKLSLFYWHELFSLSQSIILTLGPRPQWLFAAIFMLSISLCFSTNILNDDKEYT